ncbi:uncharacterized protein [Amphiura filiformis]|uniref:uncharacterized protein n=1 Tax=Amphiura filiformis TaxID=82378 RepID=UPI003B21EF43
MADPINIAENILRVGFYIHKTVKEIKTFKESAEELDHRTQLLQPSLQVLADMKGDRQQAFKEDQQQSAEMVLFSHALGDMLTCVDEIKDFVDDLKTMTSRRKLTEKGEVKRKFSNFNRRLDILERSIQFGVLVEMKKDIDSGKKEKSIKTLMYYVKQSDIAVSGAPAEESPSSRASQLDGSSLPLLSADDLDIGEELGEGGFGTVYLAKYRHAERVAVKIFDIGNNAQILKEASKMRQAIFSSSIVRLIGIIDEPSIQAIVMDYFEHGSLKSFLPYLVHDGWARRVRMLCDIASGIHHLHSLVPPLIHRDIKLANIFVDHGFNAKIGDLGITAGGTVTSKTLSKAVLIGTYSHIPPETWAGSVATPKPPVDIYEYGIAMYEFASGNTPWPSNANAHVVRGWVTDGRRPSLQDIKPDTPREVIDMMQKCWDGNPSKRPNSRGILKFFSQIYESKYEEGIAQADKAIRETIEQGLMTKSSNIHTSDSNTKATDDPSESDKVYIALFTYVAAGDCDLSFDEGERFIVIDSTSDCNWWEVCSLTTNYVGKVPSNYLTLEKTEDIVEGAKPRVGLKTKSTDSHTSDSNTKATDDPSESDKVYIALSAYVAAGDGDLSFDKGDRFIVLDSTSDCNWWEVESLTTNYVGKVPSKCLTLEKTEEIVEGAKPRVGLKTKPTNIHTSDSDTKATDGPSESDKVYIALSAYVAAGDGDLSFDKGDRFIVLDSTSDCNWWEVESLTTNYVGKVPSKCLTLEKTEEIVEGAKPRVGMKTKSSDIHTSDSNSMATGGQSEDGKIYIAVFRFVAVRDGDLSFDEGDRFTVIDSESDRNWWVVQSMKTDYVGRVPTNYLRLDKAAKPGFESKATSSDAMDSNFRTTDDSKIGEICICRFNYSAREDDEVTVQEGERCYIIENSGDWWQVELVTTGSCGYVPSNYLMPDKTEQKMQSLKLELKLGGVDESLIFLLSKIGCGQFGDVWKAIRNTEEVLAIKALRPGTLSETDFFAEQHVLKLLNHKNIVDFVGICKEPPYIVMEFMVNGCLLDFLREGKGKALTMENLIDIGAQVASAMEELEKKKIIHRDVAARNVYIGENNIAKLGGFGMAKELDSLYDDLDLGLYEEESARRFPIKWTAPEVILYDKFSFKSDVWSFGILLTELVTYGHIPYPGMDNREAVEQVLQGYPMAKPEGCPDKLYELMLQTWHKDPQSRPTFNFLFHYLDDRVIFE